MSSTAHSSDVDMIWEEDSSVESVEDQRVTRTQLAAALLSASAGGAGSHPNALSIQSSNNGQQYLNELTTMREMGFTDENNNLRALIMCDGNVEAAVSLVINTGNFS